MFFGAGEHGQHPLRRLIPLLAGTQPAQRRRSRDAGRPAHVRAPTTDPFLVHQMNQGL